jgi:hypothetical protein
VSVGNVTGVAGGTAAISYILPTGCFVTRVVTVNTFPAVDTISGPSFVAIGSTISLANATSGGTWSSSAASIATVSSIGVVSGVAAGSSTISYRISNSCGTVYATKAVTVNTITAKPVTPSIDNAVQEAVQVQAVPNPFTTQSVIRFNLPESGFATVEVYSIATGIKVATIFSDNVNAGEEYTATLDGSNLASGNYVYKVATRNITYSGKVLLIK